MTVHPYIWAVLGFVPQQVTVHRYCHLIQTQNSSNDNVVLQYLKMAHNIAGPHTSQWRAPV